MNRYKRKSQRKLVFTDRNVEEIKRKIIEGFGKRSIDEEIGL